MELKIYIETGGREVIAGKITGNNISDAAFEYSEEYIAEDNPGISLSLPVYKRKFSPLETRNYFEGLLPEGFSRRTVAGWVHADERDYLAILSALGRECLGAVKVVDSDDSNTEQFSYEKLSLDQVKALAAEGVSKSAELVAKSHLSLTGASGKVGLYYDKQTGSWYLPIGNAPSTHIVKQSHVRLDSIVCNEQLSLLTAKKLGIDVPGSFVINTGNNKDNEVLLATERYDRLFADETPAYNTLPVPVRLHQEDFAQCMGISSLDKYELPGQHYMKSMFDIVRTYSSNPIEDQLKLWDIIVFNFLIGNTDAHIKNYSLLYSKNMKSVRLAPAYDLISTIIYESSTRNMAFAIGGEADIGKISRENFSAAAKEIGLPQKMTLSRFDNMKNRFETALKEASDELSESGFTTAEQIRERILTEI